MKILSVIVPAYNVEKYIQRCLDSLTYDEKSLKYLDIIVVNDGSTDCTATIAENYAKKYPKSIRVINKENGGHGSTINIGIKLAEGKYIKILDGDDWFNIFDLPIFIEKLKNEVADIVITNYKRVVLYNNKERMFVFAQNQDSFLLDMSSAIKNIDAKDFFFRFSMPSMAIKTEEIRKVWGEGLPEHRFYVDQLFVAKVLLAAKTYAIYNIDIYRHFIGRPDQSIGFEGFYNHRFDHEYVLKKMLDIYDSLKKGSKKEVIKKQIIMMINTHYQIYFHDKSFLKESRKELVAFDDFLKKRFRDFYNDKKFKIGLLRRIK